MGRNAAVELQKDKSLNEFDCGCERQGHWRNSCAIKISGEIYSMMFRMADEDVKRSQSIAKWYEFDKDGNYNLRKDAPEDVIKIAADLEKKYNWDICES